MAQEPTYEPEVVEDARRKREHRVVQEDTALWRRRKEELQRQKHREQREPLNVIVSPRYCYRSDKGLLREIRPRDMFGKPERH
ncbi:hypothetical protein ALC62_14645 [Cyphomyrmex costatus]|uniref:Uncharacterized protein n=1 Tax=Cyphomyrmex costatus TaxID=456900 RepID=A0A195C227_9HYME|nr:hypothetical protein ALC62_14645 [Cyphomyrmex costatus]